MSDHNNSDASGKKVSRREFLKIGVIGRNAKESTSPDVSGKRTVGKGKPGPASWSMSRRNFVKIAAGTAAAAGILLAAPLPSLKPSSSNTTTLHYKGKISPEERRIAAIRANALRTAALAGGPFAHALVPVPGGVPDLFGASPNYANSPMPTAAVTIPSAGTVTGATISNGGSGYTTPHVILTGGGGTGATATARVSNGAIIGLIITNPGSGYTSPPTVTFSDPNPRAKSAAAVASVTPNSPTVNFTGGMRKFVDSLAGLDPVGINNLLQYIPVAVADTAAYPGSDYYEIELVEFTEQMHSDLPPTKLRGYRQTNAPGGPTPPHFLGPIIVAQRDRPVRVKFTNSLPAGAAGDLFIPVDTSYMGAGIGPDGVNSYKQNRAVVHLHGGTTPWISDGTPHQWITPAAESTVYSKGDSLRNVPDMWFNPTTHARVAAGTPGATNDPGPGSSTHWYSNQQSARLMFYHDHALGLTRLNVYVGEAAGYLVTDPVETALMSGGTITPRAPSTLAPVIVPAGGIIPGIGIPLVIQDRSFVDATTINAQDPTWNGPPTTGSLWFPHVYMPNQNPYDITGANPKGRWDYGPWFWPPFTAIQHGPVANPYYDPVNAPWEPPFTLGVPNISGTPESFMDTPIINGTAYPYIVVQPQAYRFRILNASNDRFFNLQLYQASSIVGRIILTNGGTGYTSTPTVTISGGGGTGATARAIINPATGVVTDLTLVSVGTGYTSNPTVTISSPSSGTTATGVAQVYTGTTEVGMVPAVPGIWPAGWGTPDGRDGGFPDPNLRGPAIIQIGTEGGFLPAPVLLENIPIDYDYNRRSIVVLNVLEHTLFLGPAERADVIIDFTKFAGKTLILYNDSPAPVPGFDPRIDYYTANPNLVDTGGAPSTLPGYGPNTRTIMQIRVLGAGGVATPNDYNSATLTALQTALPAAFAASQDTIIIPQAPYNAAYNRTFPTTLGQAYASIQATSLSFNPIGAAGGGVTGVTVLAGGTGYTTAPTVAITGGGGTGATATATISGGGVATITITNPGTGYSTAPTITFTGGGGTGAAATATVGSSALASVTVTNPGSGYTSAPAVAFTGGGGTGAMATATIGNGALTGITLTNGGSGYTTPPTVAITGGGGTGAIAVAVLGNGPVTAINLTSGGGRYTSAPTVTISGGGGAGATATATITNSIVTGITVTNGGSGYTSLPTVTFSGGQGAGAAATAVVPGATGTVTAITLTNPGIGFTSAPTVGFSGGGGAGATATAAVPTTAGTVTGITLTNAGAGYTSPPTVTLTGGGGTGATATAAALSGGIASITITNPGSGYNTAPTIGFTGGGGTGAAATATVGGTVSAVTVTNPGSGYTTNPLVTFTGGNGTGAAAAASVNLLTMQLLPKAIIEDFTLDYGRMNAILGNEIPRSNNLQQTSILQAYIDPPVEIIKFSNAATPIGSLADGTQLWKITHNGVDTHSIHFHLCNVQLVNRVGWDGAIRPPDPNELGWKESVRMNPLEDVIVAMRPITITTPFAVPNSIRRLDPTQPPGGTMNFNNVDPLANPLTTPLSNQIINYGWEYVYHCHILGHEENDMMRPFCACPVTAPTGTPSNLNATRTSTTSVSLSWSTTGIGSTATGIVIERATNAAFTAGLTRLEVASTTITPLPTSYIDAAAPPAPTWYRVRAANIVGIVGVGAYPTVSADGNASAAVSA